MTATEQTTGHTATEHTAAGHIADAHDLIEVRGARENNLQNISLDIPKRRLTVFTGVSGSGKSSLVFGTIAAESQRLINETYSAFLQSFMASPSRPDVDSLRNISAAIIVDQERMGANSRSTVGTATDAHAMLRIIFSRLGQPHVGPELPLQLQPSRGHVPAMRGHRARSTTSTSTSSFDRDKSLAEGAITIPGYTADGWMVRIYTESGLPRPRQEDPRLHRAGAARLPLQGADEGQGRRAST